MLLKYHTISFRAILIRDQDGSVVLSNRLQITLAGLERWRY